MRVERQIEMRRHVLLVGVMIAPLLLMQACARVHVDPIEVKPIHIIHDINIRVDRQLDDFFAFEAQKGAATQPAVSTTQPTTAPAPSPTTTTAGGSI